MTYGTKVYVTTQAAYERLLAHPDSVSGWFDPKRRIGEITFTSQSAAQVARREL